ncbi:aminoacyl-histidine dipeptidase [Eudoraea chungangensis]|uniref:aminoacyl-histidine dipeptidase n=1 Tax=Eudoraea chungangensis TaxID=1481905 RepID=UPI0023EB9755|nr:aminoacyl-histidine dipeptidase [Eudoraea chungangensis]
MNKEILELEPKVVWKNFSKLNAVPRPSKREERVIQFAMDFGKSLGLETFKDEVGNVIIRKPATTGMENRKMITLQSHLDMVHQKNNDTVFDFETQGIAMLAEDDWVKAKGTTLGADNGMGVAAILSLLESTSIPHPPLEALFTIDEETGMTGAQGLKPGVLQGEILLNLDTEEDDEIDIGCAGGIDITASRTYPQISTPTNSSAYKVIVKGLQGGHSGMDIHKGLGNANKIMNRLLLGSVNSHNIGIAKIDGGSLRNAIPRESVSIIVVSEENETAFVRDFEALAIEIKREFAIVEKQMQLELEVVALPEAIMDPLIQNKVLRAIYAAHNGVYLMSTAIPDLVATSNNIARVRIGDGNIHIGCLTRSSIESSKNDLATSLQSVFELAGCEIRLSGEYPGWQPNPKSPILKILKEQYTSLFNEKPKVVACHAGLECGILGQHYPNLDMISFGPTIKGAHSPDERVSISSVQKFWKYLLEILKNTP